MEFSGVMERTGRSRHRPGLRTYVSRLCIGESRLVGCVADGTPHREGQPTSETEHATHLPQCQETIGEELHALLTENHIEDTVLEGKAAASPVRHSIAVAESRREAARAASIMLAFRSTPTTRPTDPIR